MPDTTGNETGAPTKADKLDDEFIELVIHLHSLYPEMHLHEMSDEEANDV